jgi:hypothetical protein
MLSHHFMEITKTLNNKELLEVFTKLKPVNKANILLTNLTEKLTSKLL